MRSREVNSDGTCLWIHVSEPKVGAQSSWSCGKLGESCHVLTSLLCKPNLGSLHGVILEDAVSTFPAFTSVGACIQTANTWKPML